MRFGELLDTISRLKEPPARRQLWGTLRDLFGDSATEDMTPLFIEEKLERAECSFRRGGRLGKAAVSTYRSALRKIFDWAVKAGKLPSNPVLSARGRKIKKQVERLRALALLERLGSSRGKRAEIGREAVSLVRRTAGDEPANLIHELLGLGSSPARGPRKESTQRAYEKAILIVARNPEASPHAVGKLCGVDKHEVKKWQNSEDFKRAVGIERREILTDQQVRAANSSSRRSAAAEALMALPGARDRLSASQKKRFENPMSGRRQSRAVRKSWKDPDVRQNRIEGHSAPAVRAKMRAKSLNYWNDPVLGKGRRTDQGERATAMWASRKPEIVAKQRRARRRSQKVKAGEVRP